MSGCARCGQAICRASDKIALSKNWHRVCFSCFCCRRPLNPSTAKVLCGEIFCCCCQPYIEDLFPICRVLSTPSFPASPSSCSCRKPITMRCSDSSDSICCVQDTHSCSCIPFCCNPSPPPCCPPPPSPCPPRPCQPCPPPFCPPRCRSPPSPPRRRCRSPPCETKRCQCCRPVCPSPALPVRCRCSCSPPPRQPLSQPPCCGKVQLSKPKSAKCCSPSPCQCSQCCSTPCNQKIVFFTPKNPCPKAVRLDCNRCNGCKGRGECGDRCRRCGEKVFAAEKVVASCGSYHISCFSCYSCCKSLCIKTMYEANGEIYCKQCYNTYFGLNGYGHC